MATLATGPQTVGTLASPLPMSLVAVSKHLTVLERAGVIRRTRHGRHQLCQLQAASLRDAAGWLDQYRQFWDTQLDALARYLTEDENDPA